MANNPTVNKVIYGNDTLIDLTEDDVTAEDVVAGKYFHAPSGARTVGTATYAGSPTAGGNAVKTNGILYGAVDSTSTSTAFTATISGLDSYYDGATVLLKNGKVTSGAGFTININGLGAKPVYSNMGAASQESTVFNVNYTMLFVYDSTRVTGGCWICYRGYDSTDTIYLRPYYCALPATDTGYRYRLWFKSLDGSGWIPANTSTSTNSTDARTPNTRTIDPFGEIVFCSKDGKINSGANVDNGNLWQQYPFVLGYSFNTTGAALSLAYPAPIYIKCTPQTGGGVKLDGYTQSLPSTEDGKVYIYLGIAYAAQNVQLIVDHPVYYYYNGAIRLWTNAETPALPATATPLMDGTAAVGTATKYAREDHRHPSDTAKANLASPAFTGTPTAPTASSGTNSTQIATTAFVKTALSNKLDYNATLFTTNPFAPSEQKSLYLSKIDNAFFALDKRYSVSVTYDGVAVTNVAQFFDGSYDANNLRIESGKTAVFTLDFSSGTSQKFAGYPYGQIFVSFYNSCIPSTITGRVYNNYASQTVGWHDITFTQYNSSMFVATQTYYGLQTLEITMTGSSDTPYGYTSPVEIELHATRPSPQDHCSVVNKFAEQTLYYNLTAPKFIGALQGNAATATTATKATQDESGNNIKASYGASLDISGTTLSLKNKNGTALNSVTIPSELPAVTSSDNGKVLTVVSGAWEAATGSGSSPSPATANPLMDGTAAVGTSAKYAREDHVHPSDTNKQDTISDLATIRSNATDGETAFVRSTNKVLYLTSVAVSAGNGNIATVSNANITADHVVAELVFANPNWIYSDITWTTANGSLTLNGTCYSATTANIVLIKKDNS